MHKEVDGVRARVVSACERCDRDPQTVQLIAVTKGVDIEKIRMAYEYGVTEFGENRLQEARPKIEALPDARWHFIGKLQSNKAAAVARGFDVVHTIDSLSAAKRCGGARDSELDSIAVFVEIDFTGIPGRAGVGESEALPLLQAIVEIPGIHVTGLMTMAPYGDLEVARHTFSSLRSLRDRLEDQVSLALPELSMGMSEDFEVAIEEGATMVRVGRALFGHEVRLKPIHQGEMSSAG